MRCCCSLLRKSPAAPENATGGRSMILPIVFPIAATFKCVSAAMSSTCNFYDARGLVRQYYTERNGKAKLDNFSLDSDFSGP